ncbi:MAG: gamma carbonic anhydrase family protein [Gammaproteobacteria bacterium]|nr:gamma carbonic anhydrase family protein [Gammaproteobacteria bacterium]MBU1414912.1 gamma carbonic anhydrase family protein [Gammaproteobacteria bacterium]
MPVFAIGDKHPQIADSVWIAPNATVIGDVRLGHNVSIWWNAVLRGDNDPISIGENTNIQDGSVLHTDIGVPLVIAANVTVGHMVMLHGCAIGEGSLIGIGAIVLNNAVVGRECLIGAGSLIPEGKVIPERSLVMGSPGRIIRQLTDEDIVRMRASAEHYVEHLQHYSSQLVQLD